MEPSRRELLVARITSGTLRLKVYNEFGREVAVVLRQATREQRYYAQELYQDTLEEARLEGAHTEDSLLAFLYKEQLWDDTRETSLRQLEKDIEDFKTKLVGLAFRSFEKQMAKLTLQKARDRQRELLAQRHAYDHLTCDGAAGMARTRYLLACSLHYPSGQPVLPVDALWDNPTADGCSIVLENAFEAYLASRLDDADIREVARTEPWLGIWTTRACAGNLFGVPAADLTDEQVRLQVWSQMYENIAQHPECPPQEVIDDDDICDGWLILQRREREKKQLESKADTALSNEKIRNSEEVFIVASSPEDARQIESLNDETTQRLKRQRDAEIRRRGEVQHVDLADVRAWCQMERNRLQTEKG